jgi:nickel transport protein
MRRVLIVFGLFSAATLSSDAAGHDLWIEKQAGGYVLLQGHRHTHSGSELVPYAPSTVKGFLCVDDSGTARQLPVAASYPARVTADCATLAATFSTGYWTKTPWGTTNVPRTGVSGVLRSWYSEESLKLVQRWTAASANAVGGGLEITPTTNPLQLKPGDKLVVLVTDGGKPVSGVPVAYAGETRGATGDDGKVSIRLRRSGLQLLQASRETPLADGKADFAIRAATVQFEIAK